MHLVIARMHVHMMYLKTANAAHFLQSRRSARCLCFVFVTRHVPTGDL